MSAVDLVRRDARIVEVEPIFLDTHQAAKALSISERNLWSLTVPRGPIKAAKVGKLNLYPLTELRRYAASAMVGSAAPAE